MFIDGIDKGGTPLGDKGEEEERRSLFEGEVGRDVRGDAEGVRGELLRGEEGVRGELRGDRTSSK